MSKAGNETRHYFFPKIWKCEEIRSEQIVQFHNLGIIPLSLLQQAPYQAEQWQLDSGVLIPSTKHLLTM